MSKQPRWLAPALILAGVALMGVGIAEMLRVSYVQHPSWTMVIVPPVGVLIGCVMLLYPLLSRLARDSAAQEESDRRAAEGGSPPQPR